MKVLMISSEWPTDEHPEWVPFLVSEVHALRELGIEIDVFAFRGAMQPNNYLQAWREVHKKLTRGTYNLVHAQFGQSAIPAIYPKRVPMVVTFRGSDLNGIQNAKGRQTTTGFALQKISQLGARQADHIILVSQRLARFLPKHCNYSVVPTGIDLGLFQPIPYKDARKRLGIDLNTKYVLFVGEPKNRIKRFELAEAAVTSINNSLGAKLLLANGVPPEEMPLYMNAANVLLITSLHEGSPNIVKEALACNLPVVSVDVGDVRERLSGVEGSVVCKDDQPETISCDLEYVLNSGKTINSRSSMSQLDIRKTAKRISQIYQEALIN